MRRSFAIAAFMGCLLAATTQPAQATASLNHRVLHAVKGSTAQHVDYAFSVPGIGRVTHHSTTKTAPASTEKLLTTATLLEEAGSGFTYATTVSATGPVSGHTLDGDLVITGSGDPSLTATMLKSFARTVHASGIHRVSGHVVVDGSRYSGGTSAPGWKHDFVPDETGPVSALAVDRNAWRHNKAFLKNPNYYNGLYFRDLLAKAHVHVRHKPQVHRVKAPTSPLLVHYSQPLQTLVAHTLTISDNFYAEMMLREAGARYDGKGSRTGGIAAIHHVAKRLHVHLGAIHDGSGLSYTDRESPAALVAWLTAIQTRASFQAMYAAMPVSCRTGTLEHRLCGSHLTGMVHAKTGTLDNVNCLAGWMTTKSGRSVAFAVLFSGARNYTKSVTHLDAAVAAVARHA